ncbi:class I SAM-dependent methyltransferase [Luteimonas sp. 8-5]|uniref:class I SAM-dependent methyltransferase n=1 Tax=Luteimonas sp. 8-5 TaxID=3039387 RepID=UPI0024372762|nr:class I SAM-dependent methyltransferase [Luteimonas sp. 8-5]MDG6347842.1 class I SAM-dependent methyltransferase [Luteimonas sp. 8-5]
MPYRDGRRPPLMHALQVVGSDVTNFECPRCGAHDRERHLFLYLKASGLMEGMREARILHFAPERRLSKIICATRPLSYTKCDLYPDAPDVLPVNIEAMPFADNAFDIVIANHVLEHVSDDLQALREISRVLRSGGVAILQTPYSATLRHTWFDPGIIEPEARRQAYGQEDHVRLYGQDIVARFASTGLRPMVRSHAELLPDVDVRKAGVNAAEPFLAFEAP